MIWPECYPNHQLAAADPMRDALPTDVRDDGLQLRLWQAAHARWDAVPEFAGYFAWEAALPGVTPTEISHNLLDRPAEAVVWAPE